jgi:hypothetical protein
MPPYRVGEFSIIGANGQTIDPRDFEARAIVGALEAMDDNTVIGQLMPLMARFPTLSPAVSASPRLSSLVAPAIAASAGRGMQFGSPAPNAFPMGLGAAAASAYAPRLVSSEPGPVGLSLIPFNVATVAGGTVSAPIVVTPQSIFKPYKLVIDPVIAPFFMIQIFQNGTVPFFDAPGEVPASIFTSDGLPNLKKITSNPGISITLQVRNRDVVAHGFFSVVYGEAAPTQCG